MSCEHVREQLPLEPGQTGEDSVRQHLEDCGPCSLLQEAYEADAAALTAYGEALHAGPAPLAGLADAVMAAVGDDLPGAAPLHPEPEGVLVRPNFKIAGWLSAAAALLVGISLTYALTVPVGDSPAGPGEVAVEPVAPVVTPAVPVEPTPVVTPSGEAAGTLVAPRRSVPIRRRAPRRGGIVPVDSEPGLRTGPGSLFEELLQGLSPRRGRQLPPLPDGEREVSF